MKYRTIVADPPWPYRTRKAIVGTIKVDGTPSRQVGDTQYEFLDVKSIKNLNPPSDTTAHLYLWTTNAFMVEAHEVAKSWGFHQKTILTWGKVKKDNPASPSMRTGYYFRGATEHCLFCVKGSLPITPKNKPTLMLHPRDSHSVKPDWFFDMVEECSPGPYLELFARKPRPGWHVWGNEVESDLTLPDEHAYNS